MGKLKINGISGVVWDLIRVQKGMGGINFTGIDLTKSWLVLTFFTTFYLNGIEKQSGSTSVG